MNKKHTPGPWFVHIEKHKWGFTPHVTSTSQPGLEDAPICTFNGLLYRSDSETKANAELIARAPELLEVLRQTSMALKDALSTYRNDEKTVLVTSERQEAWMQALQTADKLLTLSSE